MLSVKIVSMKHFDISSPNAQIEGPLRHKIDNKTKPIGALGKLESLALQIGLIQQRLCPQLTRPTVLVFAGDHGVVNEKVSPYPQEVTAQMVMNFVQGGAAINQFAKQTGMHMQVIDAGVNADFDSSLPILHVKVAKGTKSFLRGPAMSMVQCEEAIVKGANIVRSAVNSGSNVFAFGEMGIGNTTSAAALMSVLCHKSPVACVGRGTGLDDDGVAHKASVIAEAITKFTGDLASPYDVLSYFGGFEVAMMVGAMLQAAEDQSIILVDGFIATAALLVASKIAPDVLAYSVFSHCSNEQAHRDLLRYLGGEPLLDLGLRLGEGTGAVLAYPLVEAAVNFLNGMASFESAGVSERVDDKPQ